MIHRILRLFDRWNVEIDPDRDGVTRIRGAQQWESLILTAAFGLVALQVTLIAMAIVGPWALTPFALVVVLGPFSHRFHLMVTPHGAYCSERILGYTVAESAYPLDARIELFEDDWEGPDHPIGVGIRNPKTFDEIVLGPAYDQVGQIALRSAISQAFRRANRVAEVDAKVFESRHPACSIGS